MINLNFARRVKPYNNQPNKENKSPSNILLSDLLISWWGQVDIIRTFFLDPSEKVLMTFILVKGIYN